ncbi:hypothetical protein [Nocardia ignorata]|uniref:Uncharacterized protein n=1 Tax=Nocardia ignorata TaxID=145285 RepID=A0A4R6PNZ6_NOCIG|nr:hypothetical protein [Nocardia ignorata]TDP39848.1 hypothetical protein DFR75_102567 [Nocardia ignorata]
MDYAAEFEQIAAETLRRSVMLREELDDIDRQTVIRAQQVAANAARRFDEVVELLAQEAAEAEIAEPQPDSHEVQEERIQSIARAVAPPPPPVFPAEPDPTLTPEQQRQAEIRAAVARARAAREARSVVAPSDGDYDSESEYYRRSTWLD